MAATVVKRAYRYRCYQEQRRWFPSSKTCSHCGHLLDQLPLTVREWTCPACGMVHDREVNAAENILAAGRAVTACGDGVRPPRR